MDEHTKRLADLIEAAQATRQDAEGIAEILTSVGVFYPPLGAERTEGRAIEVKADSEPMPYNGDVMYRDGRAWSNISGAERDVTDEINAWAARQPGVVVVTYEWPEPRPICPECRDGKHGNCTGEALHEATDVIVECGCSHGE
jgi:hypothetical protein